MIFGHHYFAGSPASVLVLALTAFAFFFAVVAALICALVRGALVPGVLGGMLLLAALVIAGVGLGARTIDRNRTDRALGMSAPENPEITETIRAQGYQESDQPMLFGLLGAAIPGMAGLGLLMLAVKRKSSAGEERSLRDEVTSP